MTPAAAASITHIALDACQSSSAPRGQGLGRCYHPGKGETVIATHYQGSPEEKQALNAYIALMRAADSVTTRAHVGLSRLGLTVSQFGALEAIHHLGPLCQRDLAEKLLKSTGNITLVVSNLEKRGLARRQRDALDRRYIRVHLTPKGRSLVQDALPPTVERITAEMSVLSPEEQETLRLLCRRLGKKEMGTRDTGDAF